MIYGYDSTEKIEEPKYNRSSFEKTYNLDKGFGERSISVEVKVNIYENELGCYIAEMKYSWYAENGEKIRKETEIVMSGPGRSKLEKKIIKFLNSTVKYTKKKYVPPSTPKKIKHKKKIQRPSYRSYW